MPLIATAYLFTISAMSAVAFGMYGLDKRQARAGGRRISERSLHLVALLGGWPGAWTGQLFFRHKTQKLTFRLVFWLLIVVHLSLVGGIGYLLISPRQT
jgi:uncharacterized membrane protein YsdA (DUF1294 family)